MEQEHADFLAWAAGYEDRTERGRNRQTDRAFLQTQCGQCLAIEEDAPLEVIVARIAEFLDHGSGV